MRFNFMETSVLAKDPGVSRVLAQTIGERAKTKQVIEVLEVAIGFEYLLVNDTMEPDFFVCSTSGCRRRAVGYGQSEKVPLQQGQWFVSYYARSTKHVTIYIPTLPRDVMLIAQDMWTTNNGAAIKEKLKHARARKAIFDFLEPETKPYTSIATDLVEARGRALAAEASGKRPSGKRGADLDREIDAFVKYAKYGSPS